MGIVVYNMVVYERVLFGGSLFLNGLVHAFCHSVTIFLGCDQYVDDNQGQAILS